MQEVQEVEVGIGRLVGHGGSTGLARTRGRSWLDVWGNGRQQQDNGRVEKGLDWVCWV
ncbi:hypothetical protein BDR03DRAFT_974605 [Suillus americanus]|nr:hypothetical protein BDR03DRAFT_974605 [Suillus americanus]